MTPTRARRRIRDLVRQRRYRISSYCALRMLERCVSEDDVLAALKSASRCWLQTNGRWKLEGTDPDGERLFVLIDLQEVVVVVNTFQGGEDEEEQD